VSDGGWEVRWATGSATDSRLLTSIDTGPVGSLVGAGVDDEPVLVTAGPGSVAAWSVATGEVRWNHPGHGLDVLGVAPLGDGPTVLVGGGAARIRAFDLRTGEPVAVELDPSGADIDQLRMADGGPPIVIGRARDGAVPRWDLPTGRSLGGLPTAGACFAVEVVDVDGRAVVATGHNQGYVCGATIGHRSGSPASATSSGFPGGGRYTCGDPFRTVR
jgi:WD40 repeat protein